MLSSPFSRPVLPTLVDYYLRLQLGDPSLKRERATNNVKPGMDVSNESNVFVPPIYINYSNSINEAFFKPQEAVENI